MNVSGKVALVTGGTHGIGKAAALQLAAAGADIAVVSRHQEACVDEMSQNITDQGQHFRHVVADLAIPDECTRCVTETETEFGRVDILILSAGSLAGGNIVEMPPEDWYKAFDLHIHANFHICRAAIPILQRAGEGAIVFISSAAGLRGVSGAALPYGVVKGALPQFARILAFQLGDDNIRVNCVSPGVVRTRIQDYLTPEQQKNNLENRIPLHREGTPEDVADLIYLLVTNDFITGENFVIDGGMTMRIV